MRTWGHRLHVGETTLRDLGVEGLALLRCPVSKETLAVVDGELVSHSGKHRYPLHGGCIPLFAEEPGTRDAARQMDHYERIAEAYVANLGYPHTLEYHAYLDRVFLEVLGDGPLGHVAEICCGDGEGLALLGSRVEQGVGVDISLSMLENAAAKLASTRPALVQGDATQLPLADGAFDHVVMFGGIHHVADRRGLFREVARILKPGGRFLWREPLDDFWLWRALRTAVYRLSPLLDHETERPLRVEETVPLLAETGLELETWRSCGFVGFCLLMNSDVLVINRLLRFLPGIRAFTRAAARFDEACVRRLGPGRLGLQVVGSALKPREGRTLLTAVRTASSITLGSRSGTQSEAKPAASAVLT
jgi:ubiquinone/menaquinone biosynthesis C-methylase UbiE